MIHPHGDAGTRLPIVVNSLTLNDPTDSPTDTYELNAANVMGQFDQSLNSDPSEDGTEVGPVKRSLLVARLDGTIRAPTIAKLKDKVLALVQAFDPALTSYANPTTFGVLPMTFDVPTADTANYASGFVSSIYYVRARQAPIPPASSYTGKACFFTVELIIPDARRFWGTQSSVSGSGIATNTLAGVWSWPTVTIAMAGAGSATYTIARTHATYGTQTLVLDLSAASNGQTITIDMKNKRVLVGTIEVTSLIVSGDFFKIDVGSNTITVTNGTNATTTTTWRRAWAV